MIQGLGPDTFGGHCWPATSSMLLSLWTLSYLSTWSLALFFFSHPSGIPSSGEGLCLCGHAPCSVSWLNAQTSLINSMCPLNISTDRGLEHASLSSRYSPQILFFCHLPHLREWQFILAVAQMKGWAPTFTLFFLTPYPNPSAGSIFKTDQILTHFYHPTPTIPSPILCAVFFVDISFQILWVNAKGNNCWMVW